MSPPGELLHEQLESLLAEKPHVASQRAATAFQREAGDLQDRMVLFGAGNLGRRTLAGLRLAGLQPLAFADNNRCMWGTEIEGLAVLSPGEAAERYGMSATFVMTIWGGANDHTDTFTRRKAFLLDAGCRAVVHCGLLFWKLPGVFLPYYAMDLPEHLLSHSDEVRQSFQLLADQASRREFIAQLRWRLTLDSEYLPAPVKHDIYFPPDLYRARLDEVFVDCGAYVGDTIESFLNRTSAEARAVFAFEPDPFSYERLERFHASLAADKRAKIHLSRKAIGNRVQSVSFAATGTVASSVGAGDLSIESVSLDHALAGVRPTMIKMDIEGSEADALAGAVETIRWHRPILAVSAYHTQNHFWEIPRLIHSLCSDYRIYLRPHSPEVWELVCYAVPPHRLLSA